MKPGPPLRVALFSLGNNQMIDEKRGPGRPRKIDDDALRTATEVARATIRAEEEFVDPPKPKFSGDTLNGEPLLEVALLRNYAPAFIENDDGEMVRQGEITRKLPAGSLARLPKSEARKAIMRGIAQVTENTFNEL